MQTGENVANWREKLNNKLQSEDRFNTTEPNKYSGYVYDAVWLYALALDKLIKLNQSYIQAQYIYYDSKFLASLWPHFAQTYLQLPLRQWGCWQYLPFSVVQLKGKHCGKPHCCTGVVDTLGP